MRLLLFFIGFLTLSNILFGQSYVPGSDNDAVKVKPVVPIQAYAFDLRDVRLHQSQFTEARDADIKYLLLLEPDRLLSQFRSNAGLTPKAQKYGGWESDGLAGHTLGHYLSACAMEYRTSGNEEFLRRVNYIVDELAECQRARKTGYVGAIPKEDSVFAEVAKGNIRSRGFDLNGLWSPWYTIHKVMAGLLDAYLYCDNAKALQIEKGMSDWAGNILKDLSDEQIQKMLLCEYGGMNEVLVNTYAFTGDKKYLDLSYKFHDRVVLDSLANGIDILPGRHSNTQIPKVIGTVRRFQVTGSEKDYEIGKFFWNTVVKNHSYAPGGNSNYEYLSAPNQLNDKLTDNTMETCNTYNMLKLTRHLFALKPESHLMDYYERALYNHILASQNHKTGMMCYFVPLRMGTKKEFSDEFHSFTCCVGSGIENHVKYGETIYAKGSDGSLFINLFIPSTVNWKEKNIAVTQTGNVPVDDHVKLTIDTEKPQQMSVKIRKPRWAKNVTVKLNGKEESNFTLSDGYLVLSRLWKNNDAVTVYLGAELYAESMPDNPHRKAFFYGPTLLAGNLGKTEPDPMKGIPVIVSDSDDSGAMMKAIELDSMKFKTVGVGHPTDVVLQPFNTLDDEYYTVYWDVFTKNAWRAEQKRYEEVKQANYELEKSTVDYLRVGEMQPERDHNFTGANLEHGESHTRKFRVAHDGGHFSFTMKVVPGFSYNLIATYWGMDNRGRNFDIVVEGETIATEDLNKYKESKFYDISYRIPSNLIEGKSTIGITFKAKSRNQAGPVYGVRIVKESK
ncbi:MAG TPA: beta-L-arabinofuranosidase domain-containing protein [Ohtaekwangia sp.]|nr:beta-L-arabinofuranosidase domain-containing protein [Ohtaekwangia sp.]